MDPRINYDEWFDDLEDDDPSDSLIDDPLQLNLAEIALVIQGIEEGSRLAIMLCDYLQSPSADNFLAIPADQAFRKILSDKRHFEDAFPNLIDFMPDLLESGGISTVARLIASRPHWITTEHLNDRLIPLVLRDGFMNYDPITVVQPLVHAIGINAARVQEDLIPGIFNALWKRIEVTPGSAWEGVYLAPFGQRTPPRFLAPTARVMSRVFERFAPRLGDENFLHCSASETVENPIARQVLSALDSTTAGLFAHRMFLQGAKDPHSKEASRAFETLLRNLRTFVFSATHQCLRPEILPRVAILMPVLAYPRLDPKGMPNGMDRSIDDLRWHYAKKELTRPLADRIDACLVTRPQPGDARFPVEIYKDSTIDALVTASMLETCEYAWANGHMPRKGQQRDDLFTRLGEIARRTGASSNHWRAFECCASLRGEYC